MSHANNQNELRSEKSDEVFSDKKFPIGISSFKELIFGNYLFADKSLLIKEIIEDGSKIILITRPRRFGKTLNLSMLYYFLGQNHSSSENLFEGLNISKDKEFCEEHQEQYPVIFVSFKDIKKSNYSDAYADIVALMQKLYREHRYLLEGDLLFQDEKNTFNALLDKQAELSDVEAAIEKLSEYMERKYKKAPIILIDEYDTPIQQAYLRGYYQEMIDLMRSIFGQALKDNENLGKAIVTGITRIAQESLFSGVNNLSVYSLSREKYGQYFGFTEEEVLKLAAQGKQKASMELIKEWYNGYKVGQYTLYNPWSIINCLDNNEPLKPYWVNTASNDLIAKLLNKAKPVVKKQFETLLQGKTIERPISENLVFAEIELREEALWSLLIYAGYLKVLSSELRGYELMAKIEIPNKEVGFVYDQIIANWFSGTISRESYIGFVQSLAKGNLEEFKQYLSSYLIQTSSYFDFNKNTEEQMFHVFMLGLVVGLRDEYVIQSNRESGLGRFDVIFIPKEKERVGIIIEFKTSESVELLLNKAQEALVQIKNRKYLEIFKQDEVASVLDIGLAFCGKELELVHEVIATYEP